MTGNHSRRNFLGKMGAMLTAAGFAGQSFAVEPNEAEQPNIVWITTEDLSALLGCYGDEFAHTPNIDQLASESIVYRNAYATAPICAPSRSCLITGVYATTLGTQHLRSEINIPDFIKTLPEYLRGAGYYCSNNVKTDYNFDPAGRWDDSSTTAHWRNRPESKPFFSVFNFMTTHASRPNLEENFETFSKVLETIDRHNPDEVPLPPYYPDTPEVRHIWARYYDLVTIMDQQVGAILTQLEEDGLKENTIIFFYSDHGTGVPRGKRWLYDSGLHVPLIVHVPEKFRHLANTPMGQDNHQLVSFVDFAPTVLSLANIERPAHMQGIPFLGHQSGPNRNYIYGANSRADEMFENARAIRNHRYKYIRNFHPHLAYAQPSVAPDMHIIKKTLDQHFENAENRTAETKTLWSKTKPVEELYDTLNDPHEMNNLANDPEYQEIKEQLYQNLKDWMHITRDTGLLPEAEMHLRAKQSTPYEMAQDPELFDPQRILQTAEQVGINETSPQALESDLNHEDSGVRYWAALALLVKGDAAESQKELLLELLNQDPSPSVRIIAAEILCKLGDCEQALNVLSEMLDHPDNTVVLEAARALQMVGNRAQPLVEKIKTVLERYVGTEGIGNKYFDMNYAMFISWALEEALNNCGVEVPS